MIDCFFIREEERIKNRKREVGYLIDGWKYCDTLTEVSDWSGISLKCMAKAFGVTNFITARAHKVEVVPKRIPKKSIVHDAKWCERQRKALNSANERTYHRGMSFYANGLQNRY